MGFNPGSLAPFLLSFLFAWKRPSECLLLNSKELKKVSWEEELGRAAAAAAQPRASVWTLNCLETATSYFCGSQGIVNAYSSKFLLLEQEQDDRTR